MQYTISDVNKLIDLYKKALNDPNLDDENKEMFAKEIAMLEDLLKYIADEELIKCKNCQFLIYEHSKFRCHLLNKEVNPELDYCSDFLNSQIN